jgi:hypothetical protein
VVVGVVVVVVWIVVVVGVVVDVDTLVLVSVVPVVVVVASTAAGLLRDANAAVPKPSAPMIRPIATASVVRLTP